MTRTYRMKVRAERHADARRRIIEAATYLSQTVGPRRSTVSRIARLAGVERPTVLRHFPDRISLFMACNVGDPYPDATTWKLEPDPKTRLARGLSELYSWFRRNRVILAHLLEMVASDESPAHWRELISDWNETAQDALAAGWSISDFSRPRFMCALRHVVNFWTWRSLAESGLTDEEAVRFAADTVHCAAERTWLGSLGRT